MPTPSRKRKRPQLILFRAALFTLAALWGGMAFLTGAVRKHLPAAENRLSMPRPAGCVELTPALNLQKVIDTAPAGSALCLADGFYSGPLVLSKPLTLWGPRAAIVQSTGQGSTLAVTGDDVRLLGFTIRGSGNRFDLNDSALKVTGRNALIQDLHLEGALFGLTAERTSHLVFRGNEITGDLKRPLGLRGDAVRLWETRDSVIDQNHIVGCRDMIIWYSSRNRVSNNVIYGGRYGTHFMYSDHQEVVNNKYYGDIVGVFAMYTHNVTVRNNVVKDSSPSDGMGIGVKDGDNLLVENNVLLNDNTGIYVDASPVTAQVRNRFRRNLIALNATGVVFHATESNSSFDYNDFRANRSVISVEGNGDALSAEWSRNYFDDYQGYDLNHDGLGDLPYELRSFSTEIVDHYPNLAFFRGSPAMGLMEFFSKVFPYLQPKLILRDSNPRVSAGAYPEGAA